MFLKTFYAWYALVTNKTSEENSIRESRKKWNEHHIHIRSHILSGYGVWLVSDVMFSSQTQYKITSKWMFLIIQNQLLHFFFAVTHGSHVNWWLLGLKTTTVGVVYHLKSVQMCPNLHCTYCVMHFGGWHKVTNWWCESMFLIYSQSANNQRNYAIY